MSHYITNSSNSTGECFNRRLDNIINVELIFQLNASHAFCSEPPPIEIIEAIKQNPQLAKFGPKTVTKIHDKFVQAGFKTPGIIKIITENPLVLRYQPNSIATRIEIWRGFQFGEKLTLALIQQCPEILDFNDEKFLRERIAELKAYALREKNVWRLLMASPNLLTDSLATFHAKSNYLSGVMKVDSTDAAKSGVFAYSLRKIRTRHMMLVRLGHYKERTKHFSELDPNKNPRMARIMDTSDEVFATKICNISLLEYETFEELYRRELHNKRQLTGVWAIDNVEDSDDESGSDLDDHDDGDTDVEDDVDYDKHEA